MKITDFSLSVSIHTEDRNRANPVGRNQNSSQGSVLVSGYYWFVKQCWLLNRTGLYRVQVSEKYRFLPQRFKITVKRKFLRLEALMVN